MNDEELRDYLKRFCFGREHLICSRDLVRQKNLRESDLRKKVNRLRRKAVPIASSREGYFYASNAAELYSTIRQLKEMRAGLDAAICGLEQAIYDADNDLVHVRDFLGHSDIKTTDIYARSSLTMKQKALERVSDSPVPSMPSWQKSRSTMEWLKSFGSQKA